MKEPFLDIISNRNQNPNENYNLYNSIIDPNNSVRILLDQEKTRLEQKKEKIDKEYDTKIRRDDLLQSATSRRKAYYHIIMIIVWMLIMCFILYNVQIYIPIIPGVILDLLIIAIVAGSLIYILLCIVDIQKRDRLDFNKIDFSYLLKEKDIKNPKDKDAYLMGTYRDISDCVGATCCPNGFNFVNNKCLVAKCAFNAQEYLNAYSDVREYYDINTAKNHYIQYGINEINRSPCGNINLSCRFNPTKYESYYQDLKNAFNGDATSLINHYKTKGIEENRIVCQ